MHAPLLVSWLLVALCAAAGAYCVLRARSRVPARRVSARGEALMGFGMAAMAVPAAVLAPPGWVWTAYAAVFGAGAVVACGTLALSRGRPGHHLHHVLGMAAMAYMAWAMAAVPAGRAAMSGMAGMAGATAGSPVVTGLLLLYFAGYVLWAGARLMPVAAGAGAGGPGAPGGAAPLPCGTAPPGTGERWADRPELALACRLSMGTAMLAMLLTL
ncbi:DUF5134 domain-containing protein [Streptomyces sp. DW26H14]|uniref:DUF5134 domain-containing protein n=1 Tax=Streptomyces sp. DW26H14 TaxID=3435395 RepID=UPI00403DC073